MGIKGAEEKAELAAELVKNGLTAHMVSGTMQNRDYFLNKIENSPNIESLWLTRSASVVEQFGEGLSSENTRDKIDLKVIHSGKVYKNILETSDAAKLRVTIPYTASKHGNPNCMSCHNAKEGDVLGSISMIIDVSEIRAKGMFITFVIIGISIIMIIVVFLIISRSMDPLIKFLTQ